MHDEYRNAAGLYGGPGSGLRASGLVGNGNAGGSALGLQGLAGAPPVTLTERAPSSIDDVRKQIDRFRTLTAELASILHISIETDAQAPRPVPDTAIHGLADELAEANQRLEFIVARL